MKSSRAKLLIQQWTAQGHIPPDKVQSALEIADITPNHSQWRQFLDKLLLANGGGLFLFGVVFFFAFNWLNARIDRLAHRMEDTQIEFLDSLNEPTK